MAIFQKPDYQAKLSTYSKFNLALLAIAVPIGALFVQYTLNPTPGLYQVAVVNIACIALSFIFGVSSFLSIASLSKPAKKSAVTAIERVTIAQAMCCTAPFFQLVIELVKHTPS